MQKSFCLFFLLLLFSLHQGHTQSFTIPELNSFLKMKYETLDSLLTANNYKQLQNKSDKEFRIAGYSNVYFIEGVAYTRAVIAGYQYKINSVDISYRISNKIEADEIIQWFAENGYTLTIKSMEDITGDKDDKRTYYTNKKQSIELKKIIRKVNGSDVTYYQFELSNMF